MTEPRQSMAVENSFASHKKHIPVPVIASFNPEGKMIPIYFSIEGLRIKVEKILWSTENYVWGNQYHCQITLGEQSEQVDLFFFKTRGVWTLQRPKT